ncbi:MAG: CpaE family protein [Phycisphaerae bacterium]
MPRDVRFIVLTQDEAFAVQVRGLIAALDGVKVVAEIGEPALLSQTVDQLPVEIVLVNLDPEPESILPIVAETTKAHRDLVVIVASECTDGDLILRAMRTGIREFLPSPIDADTFREAIERVAAERTEAAEAGTLITVVGASGGVGTTLITTSLACEFMALSSGQVTVVDLDHRFGQVATFLDVEPRHSLADLCRSPEQLEPQVIGRVLAVHPSGVRVLSRPLDLAESEMITAAACTGVLSNLVQLNEYVVADGPTRFDVGGKAVLALSDVTLVIVEPLVPCVRNAQRLLENMRENGINLDRVKLVCNRIGMANGYLSVKDVTETLGLEAFASIPDEWSTATGAINLGEPLIANSPKSKLRQAVQEIAQRLHGPDGQADEREAPKQGLIGRIFSNG